MSLMISITKTEKNTLSGFRTMFYLCGIISGSSISIRIPCMERRTPEIYFNLNYFVQQTTVLKLNSKIIIGFTF